MATEYIHAGFWIRVAAMLIDSLILGMLNALLIASFLGTDYLAMEGSVAHPYDLLITTTLYLINFAYFAGSTSSSWQATPGKRIIGIQVINTDGTRISFLKALGRCTIGYLLSNITFFIGYLMIAFTDKKTALHDKVFKTYVVYKE
jgi:uncharacterized RDD family membrane protein YckC